MNARPRAAQLFSLALLAALVGTGRADDAIVLHVSPQGNDAWSGRLAAPNTARTDGPLASLPAARQAVRRERLAANKPRSVRVVVAEGTYLLTSPLVLEPADSGTAEAPLVFAAAENARPVFSGGRVIAGWRARPDGLWEATVPAVAAGQWYFEQLWVNGRRAVRARSPNQFFHYLQSVRQVSLDASSAGNQRSRPAEAELRLGVIDAVAQPLRKLTPAQLKDVNLLAYHKWDNTRRRLDGVDAEQPRLLTRGEGMKPWNAITPNTPFILENFRAALDAPGEWFLDRDGTLLYWPLPGEKLAQCQFVAPALEQFVVFAGDLAGHKWVQHIGIEGLRFQHSQWLTPPEGVEPNQAAAPIPAAVMADGARQVWLSRCEVSHGGVYGVWFRAGCQDCRMEQCLVEDLGAGGVRIGETSMAADADLQTKRIQVHNNILRGGGRIFPCAVGLWIGQSGDNQITHNDIGDFLYTGISVGWRWGYADSLTKRNRIEFNHVHHIGQGVLSDMGGIYTLGPSEGTVVRNNVFHDIQSFTYGGWGLYTDEGSTGILFENNLVYRTKTGGFHQHYGRANIIRNNILAFATDQQLQATRIEDHLSFTFERNIVYFDQGDLFSSNWAKVRSELRNNCYWRADGARPDFGGQTWEQWQAMGHDAGSIVADPGFVDVRRDDYRLRDDSPARAVGFQPFDPGQAGVEGPAEWRELARQYVWPAWELPPPTPPLEISDDFEDTPEGTAPAGAELHLERRGDAIAVTAAQAHRGRHSLEIRDAAGLEQRFNPHLVYHPGHTTGTTRVRFALRVANESQLTIEWRQYETGKYVAGPTLTIDRGKLHLAGQTPAPLPNDQWLQFEMTCPLGEAPGRTWTLQIEGPGIAQHRLTLPLANADFHRCDWIGFISNAATATAAFVDDLTVVPAQ